ncbi:MAG: rod shape-determining protein MreD [Fibrobacter sp.]|jgi:rod shape-determining protein MreD|nr:rod shape-determining protein MreD [Fibrobacter sp.]
MLKKILKWAGLFFLAFILQTTLAPAISIFGIRPDLLMLVLFILAIKTGMMPAIYVGFFLGLAQDLYSPSILGQNALSKTIAGFFAGLFNEKLVRIDPIFQAVLLLLMFLLNDLVFMVVQMVKTGGSMQVIAMQILTATLPRSFYSLLLGMAPFLWENYVQAAVKR